MGKGRGEGEGERKRRGGRRGRRGGIAEGVGSRGIPHNPTMILSAHKTDCHVSHINTCALHHAEEFVCTHIYMHTCMHTHMHMDTHMHTHTHSGYVVGI